MPSPSLAALLLLAVPAGHAGDGFAAVARHIDREARRAGIASVAVLPLVPSASAPLGRGHEAAERLTTALVRRRGVAVVERTLLGKLFEERRLSQAGAVEGPAPARLAGVDAVVSGTLVEAGDADEITVRLVDLATGRIVAAASRRVALPRSPRAEGVPVELGTAFWPSAAAPDRIPLIEGNEAAGRVRGTDCSDAPRRIDGLQRAVLDLKARYWARRLKDGDSWAALERMPGSVVSDEDLRWELYDRIREYYRAASVPALSELDASIFQNADERSLVLHRACVRPAGGSAR